MTDRLTVRYYVPEADRGLWDDFVSKARNSTFLHMRGYMDYHSHRFRDSSLMVSDGDTLVAVFPADRRDDGTVCSHGGLTYGGLLTAPTASQQTVIGAFRAINARLRAEGCARIIYKPVPHIYHRMPAEEDLYAIFACCGARLEARAVASVIDTGCPLTFSQNRRRGLRKAQKAGVIIETDSADYAGFWKILTRNLAERHGVAPVHTVDEMVLLGSRFPGNIRLNVARIGGDIVAGCVLYLCGPVTHVQYISASEAGRECGALDLLFHTLIAECKSRFFDFGISTEQGGTVLNEGLMHQKEGFGGRAVCYDAYAYDL
ncbi:MAG: GNAT family N-acetyltransferase [Muribaculaceae bacterium]|nr:GNAT family N-acetyltransferase [Muribaculaceae bacterium]